MCTPSTYLEGIKDEDRIFEQPGQLDCVTSILHGVALLLILPAASAVASW